MVGEPRMQYPKVSGKRKKSQPFAFPDVPLKGIDRAWNIK
jgi:hypothetical protein